MTTAVKVEVRAKPWSAFSLLPLLFKPACWRQNRMFAGVTAILLAGMTAIVFARITAILFAGAAASKLAVGKAAASCTHSKASQPRSAGKSQGCTVQRIATQTPLGGEGGPNPALSPAGAGRGPHVLFVVGERRASAHKRCKFASIIASHGSGAIMWPTAQAAGKSRREALEPR